MRWWPHVYHAFSRQGTPGTQSTQEQTPCPLYHTDVWDRPSLLLVANLPHAYSLHAVQSMPSVCVLHLQGLILPSTVQLAKAACSLRQLPTRQTRILPRPLLNHLCSKNIESSPVPI